MLRTMFACGGTGGHVYPALALAQYYDKAETCFLVSSDRTDRDIVAAYGYKYIEIPSSNRNVITGLRGVLRAIYVLRKYKPQVLVATGGYHTAPIILAAKCTGTPIILLEQNVIPGRTNRMLARIATHTCVSFSETLTKLPNAILTGNPVRTHFLSEATLPPLLKTLSPHPTLLVLGGSQGAWAINERIHALQNDILAASFNLIVLTGETYFNATFSGQQPTFRDPNTGAVCLFLPYCEDMRALYNRSDLVISRAGATTIAELVHFQKKAILIPYPHATDQHQHANAAAFLKSGNGVLLSQSQWQTDTILDHIKALHGRAFSPTPSSSDPAYEILRLITSLNSK
jgi:UDP-N-acetylglucosamine--N-acetylmuramyl-(pentapeptide) pyrophosphoryl-undecaprenol N-acetylglucosamine transferase